MQVGDLVRYKHQKQDVGIIIDIRHQSPAPYKVMWISTPGKRFDSFGPTCHQIDWMRPTGLEVVSASR